MMASSSALAEEEKHKLLLLDLKATLIEEEVVGIITNMVSAELSNYEDSFEIITNSDMRQMVALEAEKQSMGCSNDSSCLAELAGAMGARFVMFGEVGKLGKNIIITFNLFDSQEAKAAGRAIVTINSLDVVPEKVPPAIAKLVKKYATKNEAVAAADPAPAPSTEASPTPQKVAKAEPKPEPPQTKTPDEKKDGAKTGPAFPWLAVSGLAVTALGSGAGVALYGWPSYETAINAQKAFNAVEDPRSPNGIQLYDEAELARAEFWSGPGYALIGGSLVALTAASVALYLTGTALDGE